MRTPKRRPHVCNEAFTLEENLRRHMKVHDLGVSCGGTLADGTQWDCGKQYANAEAITRHFDSQTVVSLWI